MQHQKKIPIKLGKLSKDPVAGYQNTRMAEKQPEYNVAECEVVYPSNHQDLDQSNARIIFGRDRPSHIGSGCGGKGHTRCAAIDIVVGLQGWDPAEGGSTKGEDFKPGLAEKNFGSFDRNIPGDAARIYISQRANIDDYFGLCEGSVGKSVHDSAIAMKADSIRIVARKGIKIVTGSNSRAKNSNNGKIRKIYGIDLIAGNSDIETGKKPTFKRKRSRKNPHLQPIPKGDNLVDALEYLSNRVAAINHILSYLLFSFARVTIAITEPRVGGNAGGPITVFGPLGIKQIVSFNEDLVRQAEQLQKHQNRLNTYFHDYLSESSTAYINSKHNRTN